MTDEITDALLDSMAIRPKFPDGDFDNFTCSECGQVIEGASYDHDPECSRFPVRRPEPIPDYRFAPRPWRP